MDKIKLYELCGNCSGTGLVQPEDLPEDVCPRCNGEKFVSMGYELDSTLLNDIFDKVKKVKKTVEDIWDVVKDN